MYLHSNATEADRQTHRQTDRCTDGQTDVHPVAKPAKNVCNHKPLAAIEGERGRNSQPNR